MYITNANIKQILDDLGCVIIAEIYNFAILEVALRNINERS
jgi:hypothetical protein